MNLYGIRSFVRFPAWFRNFIWKEPLNEIFKELFMTHLKPFFNFDLVFGWFFPNNNYENRFRGFLRHEKGQSNYEAPIFQSNSGEVNQKI